MKTLRVAGFTLVELLVAVAVMALLSLMAWRAIDGMAQTQAVTREHSAALTTLQAAVGQWVADLDAVQPDDELSAIDFDGRVLRLIRRDALDGEHHSAGLRVVAWSRHTTTGRWARWQSPPLQRRAELRDAWQRASVWANGTGEPIEGEVRLLPLLGWEVFYFRDDAWTNPLSAAGNAPSPAPGGAPGAGLPDGVRVVLELPAGGALSGRLQRDWVRPVVTRTRS